MFGDVTILGIKTVIGENTLLFIMPEGVLSILIANLISSLLNFLCRNELF